MKKAAESVKGMGKIAIEQAAWMLGVADGLAIVGFALIFLSAYYRSKIKRS